jgi:AbrB family looped-hinge helix DNA binding protein
MDLRGGASLVSEHHAGAGAGGALRHGRATRPRRERGAALGPGADRASGTVHLHLLPHCAQPWHTLLVSATVILGGQGRLVVPADVRKELGLQPGDELVLHTEEGRIVLERRSDAVARLRGLYSAPSTRGAVDELVAERRRAARHE